MPRHTYALIGEHASPEAFKEYFKLTALEGLLLELDAQRVDSDELSDRRDEQPEQLSFKFRVATISNYGFIPWSFDGRPLGLKDVPYLLIEVRENSVEFDIFS